MRTHCARRKLGQRKASCNAAGSAQQLLPGATGKPKHRDRCRLAFGSRKLLREAEDSAYVGTAESVDGLVRVTHDDQIPPPARENLQKVDLRRIRVLVFVDEDRGE